MDNVKENQKNEIFHLCARRFKSHVAFVNKVDSEEGGNFPYLKKRLREHYPRLTSLDIEIIMQLVFPNYWMNN